MLSILAVSFGRCLRKVLLTGIVTFFPRGSLGQLVVGLILSTSLSWVYHNIKPYKSPYDDVLAQLAQSVVFFVLMSKLVLQDSNVVSSDPSWAAPFVDRLDPRNSIIRIQHLAILILAKFDHLNFVVLAKVVPEARFERRFLAELEQCSGCFNLLLAIHQRNLHEGGR